ncbi:hypothetical protein LCGC14_1524880 [marine sediment metagenome]|uniref:Nickel pincer cofactor biosynthesis protein LarC n=1 Tax=marine sediment metagenome TaxID=412755 RepID=A0A0F9JID8_9ZZZZ
MRILYLDLFNSGISGDMFLASLLGLVPDYSYILKKLEILKEYLPGISNLEIKLIKAEHSGIKLNQLKINIKETKNRRRAKTLQTSLNEFLTNYKISDSAKNYANNVLNSLIQAEAEVHGKLTEKIHLHELSSVDTLIDILGVVLSLDAINYFNEDIKIFCSSIPLGGGTVETKHGLLAIPAPATLKILEKSDLITFGGPIKSELVTPTGAALLANLDPIILQYSPEMNILKSIYSTGQKKFKNFLNILRVFYGESKELDNYSDLTHHLQKYVEQVSILETDVDDVSGEILGNLIDKLVKAHILDIHVFPSITKKNRPGHTIKVLCYPKHTFELIETIIHELGTLGVRFNVINRVCIDRKIEKKHIEINGRTYEVNYKVSYIESDKGVEIINIKPEYNDLKKISKDSGLSIKKVQLIVQAELKQILYEY